MGMLGSIGAALGKMGQYYTSPEGIQTLGALAKDYSAGGMDNYSALQGQRQKNAALLQQQAQAQALFNSIYGNGGGDGAAAGPSGAPAQPRGVNLRDPRQQMAIAQAAMSDPKLAETFINMGKAAQPNISNINGWAVDGGDPTNAGKFFGDAPTKGARPVFDGNGQHVGWQMAPGSLQALQDTSQATALGTTMGTLREVPVADGSTRMMTGQQYMQNQTGGGMPGLGVKPSEAQQLADKTIAQYGATAQTSLPDYVANAGQIVGAAKSLKTDPGLHDRLGLYSKLPAIPGTAGVGVDAKIKQLKGMGFMSVYQQLRGAGAITQDEGTKATDAWARLDQAQNEKDFNAALDDVINITNLGLQRMQQKSQMAPAAGQPGVTARQPSGSSAYRVVGVRR